MIVLSAALALGLAVAPAPARAGGVAAPPAAGVVATPTSDVVAFRFGWPERLGARVEYERARTRRSQTTELSLRGRLLVEPIVDGLRFGLGDWKRTDGKPVDPLLAASGKVTTIVTRGGEFVRIEGTEAGLAAIKAAFKDAPAEAKPALERLLKMAPAMIQKEETELWQLLVQMWRGVELEVGEDYEIESREPVAVLPGETIRLRAQFRVERRLPCPTGNRSCVEVRMRSEPDAEDVARVTKRLMAEVAGAAAAQVAGAIGEMSAVTEYVLVTEPARLVPYRVEKVRTSRIAPGPDAPAGAQSGEGRDVSRWTFIYPARGEGG